MADIFISYASEDRSSAQRVATALGQRGWSVWWDRQIITGDAYDRTIESELDAAKCVVVLWSKHSVASEWVKNEAASAVEHGTLVPGMIETVKLPLEFRRRQTADLSGWNDEGEHAGWQALVDGIAIKIGGSRLPMPPIANRTSLNRILAGRKTWGIGLATVAVLGFGIIATRTPSESHDAQADAEAIPSMIPSAVATPADESVPAPTVVSYPMTCRAGGVFEVASTGKGVRIGFGGSSGPASAGLEPGQCAWADRALNEYEPPVLCDDTSGAAALVDALAQPGKEVHAYVHFDADGKCMRVVKFGS